VALRHAAPDLKDVHATADVEGVYCARHADIDAGWECLRCGSLHCPSCVRRVGERVQIAACSHCDGVLRSLDVQTIVPAATAIPRLLARLRTGEALAMVVVVGLLSGLAALPLPIIELMLGLLALLCTAATYVNVADHLARGRTGFPAPVQADGDEWLPFLQRGALVLLILATPLGLWLGANRGAENLWELITSRPGFALFLWMLACCWFSAALIAMLAGETALLAFWPPALTLTVMRSPRSFVLLALLMAVSGALTVGLHELLVRGLRPWPFVGGMLAGVTAAAMAFAQALVAGELIRRD
jgi:hypothetical protein